MVHKISTPTYDFFLTNKARKTKFNQHNDNIISVNTEHFIIFQFAGTKGGEVLSAVGKGYIKKSC